jgi:aryl-alcohol dehydrogenase-like predicted oxidoreductase
MKYNQLGRTGLFVSEICLGAMTYGAREGAQWEAIGQLPQRDVDAQVERAFAAGVNFIDTADVYGQGSSEQMVGQALRTLGVARKDVVLATKVYGPVGEGPNDLGASRGHIMDAVRASLARLQMDYIDLYQIHANDAVTPVEETLRTLDDLVRQGLIRYVGVSNWPAWKIAKAQAICEARGYARIQSHQAYYSIAGRDLEREGVPMMLSEGVGLMVWSPLAGGLLSGKFGPGSDNPQGARRTSFDFPPVDRERAWRCVAEMRKIAEARAASVAQVALAWLLHQPATTSVIVGAKRVEQLDDNLAAAELSLSGEELAALDAASKLPPEYPGWALTDLGRPRRPAPFVKKG